MSEIITIGLDLAKHVFQVHGADASGRAVLRKKLRRDEVAPFFADLPARLARLPRPMVATATVLVLLGVGLTVVAGPLYGYAERSATDIVEGVTYVGAVLPEGIR